MIFFMCLFKVVVESDVVDMTDDAADTSEPELAAEEKQDVRAARVTKGFNLTAEIIFRVERSTVLA